ncbi:MAG: SDR family NAD(P)-dependent oxidoreductase [Opitutales bacterium]|nr:SDR family NAD(P)-dependent oxidoreductase [Opitutales bacterium]
MIITGGSSGIGKSFIELMSKIEPSLQICNLSRSESERFLDWPQLTHFACDLSRPEALEGVVPDVLKWLERTGSGRILLINNSGYGLYGQFTEIDREAQLNMMDLNVRAVVDLTHRLLPALQASGGHVLNVASIAGHQPTPYLGVYGATKAFVLQWSLAMGVEHAGRGVGFTVLCPGPTESQFFQRAGFDQPPVPGMGHSAEFVVNRALQGVARGRAVVTTGWMNRLTTAFSRRLPLSWQAAISGAVMRRMRLEQKQGSSS